MELPQETQQKLRKIMMTIPRVPQGARSGGDGPEKSEGGREEADARTRFRIGVGFAFCCAATLHFAQLAHSTPAPMGLGLDVYLYAVATVEALAAAYQLDRSTLSGRMRWKRR